ncbi:MAG: YbhN family protein [Halobacteriaceae archaeon]
MDRETVTSTAVGLATAALVFGVMFWLVDTDAVLAAAGRADLALLAVVGLTILLWNAAWGLALWTVLASLSIPVAAHRAVLIHAAGAFVNHVTPLGQAGGEPVTAWLLSRSADTDYEVGLASVASLDAINVLPSVTFAICGLTYILVTRTFGSGTRVLLAGTAAVAVGLPVLGALAWRHRRNADSVVAGVVDRVGQPLARVVPRLTAPHPDDIAERVRRFVEALEAVTADRRRLGTAISYSALGWSLQAVGLWVAFLALDAAIPLYVPFFVVPIGTMASVLPTPGGLGGIEAVNVTVITLITGVGAATVAVAVTIHSVGGYLLTTTVGAAAASALGVRT